MRLNLPGDEPCMVAVNIVVLVAWVVRYHMSLPHTSCPHPSSASPCISAPLPQTPLPLTPSTPLSLRPSLSDLLPHRQRKPRGRLVLVTHDSVLARGRVDNDDGTL